MVCSQFEPQLCGLKVVQDAYLCNLVLIDQFMPNNHAIFETPFIFILNESRQEPVMTVRLKLDQIVAV